MSTLQDKCLNTLRSGTPLWSQDQAIAYEAALDCIRDMVGEYLDALAEEEQKEDRDFKISMLSRKA